MAQDDSHAELTRSGLNLIAQAISIFDADLRLAVANSGYQQMFDLPERLIQPGDFQGAQGVSNSSCILFADLLRSTA